MNEAFNLSGPSFLMFKMRIMVVKYDTYTGNDLCQNVRIGFTHPRGPSCSEEHGLRMCSCWQKGANKVIAGGSCCVHCLIVFTWSSLGSFKKETWSYRCPYAPIFVFLTLIFSEMKVTQMKCDWGRKRDGSENCQLHSEALILIWLPCGWENIFRIQYAQLQNKCINIGIFPTDGCVPLGEKNNGNIFAIAKLNIKHQWINLRNTKAYMKNPLQLYSEA